MKREVGIFMTRIATFLRPVPVTATAIAAATGAWLAWSPVAGADTTEPGSIADLVERTSPAVVTILSTQEADEGAAGMPEGSPFGPGSPFEEFFRRFGAPEGMPAPQPDRGERGIGVGSGFVIEDDGYIVTNNHVVGEAARVEVDPAGQQQVHARAGRPRPAHRPRGVEDRRRQAAALCPFGDSNAAQVGDWVIAVGNPFGLGGSVTTGIVSARGRDIHAGQFDDFLQIDAPINRGNSGGPTFNLSGEVIGINTAIYSPNGGSVGIGFAVPSNVAKVVATSSRPAARSAAAGSAYHPGGDAGDRHGDRPRRPARRARRRRGRGRPLGRQARDRRRDPLASTANASSSSRELPKLVAAVAPDADVKVEVLRQGKPETVTMQLGRFDDERQAALDAGDQPDAGKASEKLGATLATVTPAAREQLGLADDATGVVITSLDGKGLAADAGLAVGDVILAGRHRGGDHPTRRRRRDRAATTDAVLLQIERQGAKIFVGVRLA